ncbi:MAG: 4Fe-4S dicluster domain-containing protein [Streptosporangiales bacterium]|nr:4Fe-4S dicluster domain-containing protein [Streptosporangiales bacterium]MBO0891483.1 4Fe-4S dicluster domain-containing protein [Acidothermales bacterium]
MTTTESDPTTHGRTQLPGSAFDEHRPPPQELVDDCVHCGFCLPTCPTYDLWAHESDSPRGRIDLINSGLHGAPLTDSLVTHIDRCLGCMACVTACPSGVQYDKIVTATRAQIERLHKRPLHERMLRGLIFSLFPYPGRMRVMRRMLRAYRTLRLDRFVRTVGLYPRLPGPLRAMESIAPPLNESVRLPIRTPAEGERRAVVGLLTGCVQDVFFSDVNAATARVLAAEGCDVIVPQQQGCCGALSLHNGREQEAQRFARAVIDAFDAENVDVVVVNAAGCGSAMKEYVDLLADDPDYADRAKAFDAKVRDLAEYLVELVPVADRRELPLRVAYHDACHLAHAQGIRSQPRRLLQGVPGVTVVEPPDAALCCGSAGVYNLLQPEAAEELGARKAEAVASVHADVLVTANPGCLMQIGKALAARGTPLPMVHTAQLLDTALNGTPLPRAQR